MLSSFLGNYSKYVDFFKKMSDEDSANYIKALEQALGKEKLLEMSEMFFLCRVSYEAFLEQLQREMDEVIFKYVEHNKDNIKFH